MMLNFYPRKRPKAILDATVNVGRFWKGSKRKIVGLDIDPKFHPDVVGDNREHLTEAVRLSLGRSEIVITMGGLGPTEDDLTRECVAEALRLAVKLGI